MQIKKITFEEILPIWQKELWPADVRSSPIEPTSAMSMFGSWVVDDINGGCNFVDNHYDLENMKFTPTFWGYFIDDQIIGVNSGHMCLNKHYRSRGLWVNSKYRGLGIGQKLLIKTMAQGFSEKAILCWSYPREESYQTYKNVGFRRTHHTFQFHWTESETGKNCKVAYLYDSSLRVENPSGMRPC